MLFRFRKYLQPTHYFGLKIQNGNFVFPKVDATINSNFPRDNRYQSETAKTYDQSWRALLNGYINYSDTIKEVEVLSVFDNYVFSRKYFSKAWVYYVLLLRLLSLKNPIEELSGFFKSRQITRYLSGSETFDYTEYEHYQSQFLKTQPLVSVIIPTLNRYPYLKDVLKDLEVQDYSNFEVIVVDQSEPFEKDFYNNYDLNLRVEYQQEKALWLARNTAIKQSKGDYILLFDDDSRVEPNWISEHLKALDFFNADISSGVSISKVGDKIPAHYSYFKISDQLDTGNVLLKKSIFTKIGLFDRQFEKQRMGDGEFGLRAFLNGYKNVSNPHAKRLHLKVGSGGLRDMGSWDAFRTKNLFQPRPIPSVLYFYRRYFGDKRSLLSVLRTVPISVVPYQYKSNKPMLVLSGLIALVLFPLILFQIIKSWRLSSKKLKEGPKIEML
ncbi:glycosyltransferase family 2 protein [Winogradskyella jejuensis]|uniref:Glycosyltransferase, GT2 family n=1 Tax=Winogradskyella jejuensis TaxID=1089305 RepID=A0A1M5SLA1_9FLAO|nr:glycosyltransferase family A protein [Winogradskyella jejuensis]SHH39279.1 Glycosyltransferase, GT2 family [Winogradskyella jejuensis]